MCKLHTCEKIMDKKINGENHINHVRNIAREKLQSPYTLIPFATTHLCESGFSSLVCDANFLTDESNN